MFQENGIHDSLTDLEQTALAEYRCVIDDYIDGAIASNKHNLEDYLQSREDEK